MDGPATIPFAKFFLDVGQVDFFLIARTRVTRVEPLGTVFRGITGNVPVHTTIPVGPGFLNMGIGGLRDVVLSLDPRRTILDVVIAG